MARTMPCSTCGAPMHVSPGRSHPEGKAVCLECRAERRRQPCTTDGCDRPIRYTSKNLCGPCYQRIKAARPEHHCSECGRQLRNAWKPTPVCRDCWGLVRRRRSGARRSAAERKRSRAAKGSVGAKVWYASRPCLWCGTDVGIVTGRMQTYCSAKCKRKHSRVRRQGREANAPGSYTWVEVMRVFLRFDKRCAYCEQVVVGPPDPDHVVPLSRGGINSLTNILPSCRLCNSDKRDLLLCEWNADRIRRGLPLVTVSWAASDPRVSHLALPTAQAA